MPSSSPNASTAPLTGARRASTEGGGLTPSCAGGGSEGRKPLAVIGGSFLTDQVGACDGYTPRPRRPLVGGRGLLRAIVEHRRTGGKRNFAPRWLAATRSGA